VINPKISYSLVYFALNACNAVNLAFVPLHCQALGFSPFQIALVSAGLNIGSLLGSPGFAALAHYSFSGRKILFACSLGCFLLYLPILASTRFALFFSLWLPFAFMYSGCVVTVDTRAIRESLAGTVRFERVRLWGSIGFICSIALLGRVLDTWGVRWIIFIGAAFAAAIHVCAYTLLPRMAADSGRSSHNASTPDLRRSSGRYTFLLLLLAVAFCWMSHGALYVYFSIYLKALGWSGERVALAWNIGVVSEVLLFLFFPLLEQRFSLAQILQASALLTLVRWLILASTQNPAWILLSQILHAFSFGSLFLSSMKLVHQILPPALRDRGQGLLSGLGSGGGSLCGRIVFGFLAANIGDARFYYRLFDFAAAIAFLSGVAAWLVCRRLSTDFSPETC
jgi:PPP family 3-phenylpropionic acid transporter